MTSSDPDEFLRTARFAWEARGEERVLRVSGELDLASGAELRSEVRSALDRSSVPVRLDLGALEFIDPSGIRSLIVSHRDAQACGVPLRVGPLSTQSRRVIDLTGVDSVLEVEARV